MSPFIYMSGDTGVCEQTHSSSARNPKTGKEAALELERRTQALMESWPRPGAYVISNPVIVRSAAALSSREVGKLEVGAEVEVLEIDTRAAPGRVRGRVGRPAGWISIAGEDGLCWAVRRAEPPVEPPHAHSGRSAFSLAPPEQRGAEGDAPRRGPGAAPATAPTSAAACRPPEAGMRSAQQSSKLTGPYNDII